MSDDDQFGGDDQDDSPIVQVRRSQIRELEKAAKAGKSAQERLAHLERDLAFRDAGIDVAADPRLGYFIKGYEGEYTADAIKAAATQAGFLKAPDQPQQPNLPAGEIQALQRMSQINSGPQAPDVSMDAAFHTALAAARSTDEVMAVCQKFGVPTPGME